jgi:hypothetical protein
MWRYGQRHDFSDMLAYCVGGSLRFVFRLYTNTLAVCSVCCSWQQHVSGAIYADDEHGAQQAGGEQLREASI